MGEKFNNILDELKEKTAVLGNKAVRAARTVGDKTGETVEIAAVNVKIKKAETEVGKLYRDLGEVTYKNAALEPQEQEDVTPYICALDAKYLEIDNLKQDIEAIKVKYADKAQGDDVEVEIVTEDTAQTVVEEMKVCPVCGKAVSVQDAFCQFCGEKL